MSGCTGFVMHPDDMDEFPADMPEPGCLVVLPATFHLHASRQVKRGTALLVRNGRCEATIDIRPAMRLANRNRN